MAKYLTATYHKHLGFRFTVHAELVDAIQEANTFLGDKPAAEVHLPNKDMEARGNGSPYLVVSAAQQGYEVSVVGVPESATYRITFNGPGAVAFKRIKAMKPHATILFSREYCGSTIVM